METLNNISIHPEAEPSLPGQAEGAPERSDPSLSSLDSMEREIEAILFASGEPLEGERIAEVLGIEERAVKNLIERIRDRYQEQKSPLDIVSLSGAFQMTTLPQYGNVIRAALELRRAATLSQAALEVLAIIAYNQPVTRSFVEQVRGVDCSTIVRNLVEKGLVEEAGRMNIPGKPIVYKTTPNFLRCFGLETLEQLPTLPEMPEDPAATEEEPQLEGQIDFFEEL